MSERAKPCLTQEEVLDNLHLPTSGEIPFLPPHGWHPTQPLPTRQGGFIDRNGRIWTKGRSITPGQHFEWDIQLPHGQHLNVNWAGSITHPKPPRRSGYAKEASSRKPKSRR